MSLFLVFQFRRPLRDPGRQPFVPVVGHTAVDRIGHHQDQNARHTERKTMQSNMVSYIAS